MYFLVGFCIYCCVPTSLVAAQLARMDTPFSLHSPGLGRVLCPVRVEKTSLILQISQSISNLIIKDKKLRL